MSDERPGGERPRARRTARNESAFREVNERIEELTEQFELGVDEFLCECADPGCTARVRMPVDEYERVRAHGRRFIVAVGHEQPAFERVIDTGDGWLVVEKTGEAGERAADDDPRAE